MRRNPQYRPPRGRRQGVRYPEAMLPLAGYRTPCRTWDARTPLRIFPPASRMSSLQLIQGYCGTHKDSDSPVPSSRSCLSTYGKWYDATEPSLLACALRCVACGDDHAERTGQQDHGPEAGQQGALEVEEVVEAVPHGAHVLNHEQLPSGELGGRKLLYVFTKNLWGVNSGQGAPSPHNVVGALFQCECSRPQSGGYTCSHKHLAKSWVDDYPTLCRNARAPRSRTSGAWWRTRCGCSPPRRRTATRRWPRAWAAIWARRAWSA